jgi:hypothetical protein
MAICCLMMETLESFWQGLDDSTGRGRNIFESFFRRSDNLIGLTH